MDFRGNSQQGYFAIFKDVGSSNNYGDELGNQTIFKKSSFLATIVKTVYEISRSNAS